MKFASVLLACALVPAALLGQYDTGEISGAVRDTSGALIPDVKVVAQHTATGLKMETATDSAGEFVLRPLRIGAWSITAGASGFKQQRVEAALQVNQHLRVEFALPVGQVTETVEVTSAAPRIATETSSREQVIDERKILDLPLITRDYTQLALVSVGVAPPSGKYIQGGPFGIMYINGNRIFQNNFLIDGVDANTITTNLQEGTVTYVNPDPDAIQEFNLQTSSYSAEFGKSAGGVINVSIKSGANEVHGSAFEFHRDDDISARNFFAARKPSYNQNQFGGSVGGPVLRNRTFFFGDYQGTRISKGVPMIGSVPSAALRGGDFTGIATVTDPSTKAPFPNNLIPVTQMDPVTQAYANLFPMPNISGRDNLANNYLSTPSQTDRVDQFDTRLDHRLTNRINLFGRFSYTSRDLVIPTHFTGLAEGADSPDASGRDSIEGRHLAVGMTGVISPASVNEFRFGYGEMNPFRAPVNYPGDSPTATVQKIAGISVPFPDNTLTNGGLPQMQINGYTFIGRPFYQPKFANSDTINVKDTISFLWRAHNVKAGVDSRHTRDKFQDVRANIGGYGFQSIFSGNAFGDFLLGMANQYWLTSVTQVDQRQNLYNGFLQDDWKITPKLALNLGMRYEFATPLYEANNHFTNFDPSTGKFVLAQNGSLASRSLVNPDYRNIAPRVGFAYLIAPKTVIRSAYGIFFVHEDRRGSESSLGLDPPFLVDLAITSNRIVPAAMVKNGLPSTLLDPNKLDLTGAFLRIQDPNQRSPYSQQWNFTLQRELPGQIVLEAGYVGNKGTKLPTLSNLNQAAPGATPLQTRVLYPAYGTLEYLENRDSSNYQALQVRAEKRLSQGLSLLASYTFSKVINHATENMVSGTTTALGSARDPQDRNNLKAERGPAEFDIRNRFVLSHIWELPFGKGRQFGTSWSPALNAVLGGWQFSGIATMQSGRALTVYLASGLAPNLGGERLPRPDMVCNPNNGPGTVGRFFNTACFATPTTVFGNSGRGVVIGPGVVNFDTAFAKDIGLPKFTENAHLQFRLEFFNLFNHPNFLAPAMTAGSAGFGSITSALEGRQTQLAVKLLF